MRLILLACRLALLVGIALSVFLLWVYGEMFLPIELRSLGLAPSLATVLAIIGTVLVLTIAPALPIRTLFPARSLLAATAAGWLPFATVLLQVIQWQTTLSPAWVTSSLFKAAACWVAVVAGTALAGRLKSK